MYAPTLRSLTRRAVSTSPRTAFFARSSYSYNNNNNSSLAIGTSQRGFRASTRAALREDKDQSGEELERAKREQAQQGGEKSRAREEVSSQSESNVAADRENVHDHDEHIDDLQKQTAQQHQDEHPEGKS